MYTVTVYMEPELDDWLRSFTLDSIRGQSLKQVQDDGETAAGMLYSVPFGPRGVSIPGEMKPMPPTPLLIASLFRLSWIFS